MLHRLGYYGFVNKKGLTEPLPKEIGNLGKHPKF